MNSKKRRKKRERIQQEAGEKYRKMSLQYALRPEKVEQKPVVSDERSRYQRYIQSAEWRLFRMNLFAKRGARCETCGNVRNLQVHHLTYARLGKELDGDVRILCEPCHRKTHGLSAVNPNVQAQKVAAKPIPERARVVRRGGGGFTVDRKGRPQKHARSSMESVK